MPDNQNAPVVIETQDSIIIDLTSAVVQGNLDKIGEAIGMAFESGKKLSIGRLLANNSFGAISFTVGYITDVTVCTEIVFT